MNFVLTKVRAASLFYLLWWLGKRCLWRGSCLELLAQLKQSSLATGKWWPSCLTSFHTVPALQHYLIRNAESGSQRPRCRWSQTWEGSCVAFYLGQVRRGRQIWRSLPSWSKRRNNLYKQDLDKSIHFKRRLFDCFAFVHYTTNVHKLTHVSVKYSYFVLSWS